MIQLRVLGSPSLGGDDDERIEALLAQPKRLALLAYLATEEPGKPQSRDWLLSLFWAQSEENRARAALRQAIHFIRRSLGYEAIVGVGNDRVLLKPEVVWCDATHFESHVAARDYVGALALYQGELLHGVHLPDCPDFDRWLMRRRERLRAMAADASIAVAEQEISKDNPNGALFWVSRGETIAPTNERLVRLAMTLYDKLGERAAALAKFNEFSQWLHSEFGVSPSKETAALVREIAMRAGDVAETESTRPANPLLTPAFLRGTPPFGSPHPDAVNGNGSAGEQAVEFDVAEFTGRTAEEIAKLVEHARDIIYVTDLQGNLKFTNPAATRLLGYTADELMDRPLVELVRDDHRLPTIEFYLRQIRERIQSSYYEAPIVGKSGDIVWLGNNLQLAEREGEVTGLYAVARDITARRRAERIQQRLAWKDSVTGMYSKDAFDVLAEHRRLLSSDTDLPLQVLSLVVDNLDEIQHERGRTEADRALLVTAQLLRETFRRSDVIARVGRNRFSVLTAERSDRMVSPARRRLEELMKSHAASGDLPFHLRIKIDVVTDAGEVHA